MQAEEEGVDDLATLEVLDEVRRARQHVKRCLALALARSASAF